MDKAFPRVVSLVPSWTETLFAYGLESLAGVTRWCVHPRELVALAPQVGGTKDPDVARILALKPDLVVCEKEENRREDVEALRAAGLHVWLSEVKSLDDCARESRSLAAALGRPAAGEALAARIADARAELAASAGEPLPVYVPIWRAPWMTLTRDTYAHDVLAAAGATNVFGPDEGRYPERGPEEAIEAGAQFALLPTEPYPFDAKPQAIDELVDAGFPPERIAIVDGEALTWYGARAPQGLRQVAQSVHALRHRGV